MSTLVAMPKGKEITRSNNVTGLPSFSSWFDNFFDNSIGTEFLLNFNTGITLPAVNIKETERQISNLQDKLSKFNNDRKIKLDISQDVLDLLTIHFE